MKSELTTISFIAWFITVIGSPFIIFIYYFTDLNPGRGFLFSSLAFPFIFIPVSFPFLLPSIVAYYFIYEKTEKKQLPVLTSKIITSLVGVTLIFGVYYLIAGNDFSLFLIFPVVYSLLLTISTVFLKKPN